MFLICRPYCMNWEMLAAAQCYKLRKRDMKKEMQTKDFQSSKESVVGKNGITLPIPGIPWTF